MIFFEEFIKYLCNISVISVLEKPLSISLICPYSVPPNEALCLGINLNRFPYECKTIEDI
jgi:hypothetical protein